MKRRRLYSQTYDASLLNGAHHITISIVRESSFVNHRVVVGDVHEIAVVGRGKVGLGLDELLLDLGIAISRAIQDRDPTTGEKL